MNHYGQQAKTHWSRFLPTRYSQIPDPEAFFTILGEEVGQEIDQLADLLAGEDPPGEDYRDKQGRLTAARQQAREKVLGERVLCPAEPGSVRDESDPDETDPEPEDQPVGPPAMSTGWVPMGATHPAFPDSTIG
ncbi:MAG: hypothetical protein ACRDQ5_27165 [Sciscionella sp.]